jgi:hypothetical protein
MNHAQVVDMLWSLHVIGALLGAILAWLVIGGRRA